MWLKDGASCIVLANPGLLPQVLEVMQRHLDYRWTFAWRTGATSNRAKDRGILNRWRPLIWFGKGPGARAMVSDWLSGSSLEDALAELVERLTDPGALVVDPLVGTSNTAVAAVRAGRRFLGFAADAQVVATATARLQKLGLICESPVAAPSPRDDTDDGTAAEQVSDGSSKEHDDEPGDGRHNDSAPDRRADRQIMAVTDPLPSEGDKARQGLLDDMEAAARNVDAEQAAAMTEPEGRDEEPDQPPPALEATGPCSVPAPSLRPNEATQEPSVSTGDAQETILRPVAMAAEGDHLTVWTCEPRSASSPIPGSAPAMGDAGERSSGASLDDVSRSAPPELRPSVLVKRARRASRRRPELTPAQMETAKRLIEQARRRGADVKVINGGLSIVNVSLIPNLTGLLYQHEDLIVACLAGQDGRPGDWTEEAATTEGPEPEPVPTERLHDAAEHASR